VRRFTGALIDIAVFATETGRRFLEAEKLGADFVKVTAGEVHREVGGYPARNHGMPTCCDAMYREQRDGDSIVSTPRARRIIGYRIHAAAIAFNRRARG